MRTLFDIALWDCNANEKTTHARINMCMMFRYEVWWVGGQMGGLGLLQPPDVEDL